MSEAAPTPYVLHCHFERPPGGCKQCGIKPVEGLCEWCESDPLPSIEVIGYEQKRTCKKCLPLAIKLVRAKRVMSQIETELESALKKLKSLESDMPQGPPPDPPSYTERLLNHFRQDDAKRVKALPGEPDKQEVPAIQTSYFDK